MLGQRTTLLILYSVISMGVTTLRCILELPPGFHHAALLSLLDVAFDACQGIVFFLLYGLEKKQKIFESLHPLTVKAHKAMCAFDSMHHHDFKYDLHHMISPSLDLLHLNHVHREVRIQQTYQQWL